MLPPEKDIKSGITTHRNSHRRINSNSVIAEYKSMQDLMHLIVEKLVNSAT